MACAEEHAWAALVHSDLNYPRSGARKQSSAKVRYKRVAGAVVGGNYDSNLRVSSHPK
jgi:hypothetical protein